jgi:hypothetical protein
MFRLSHLHLHVPLVDPKTTPVIILNVPRGTPRFIYRKQQPRRRLLKFTKSFFLFLERRNVFQLTEGNRSLVLALQVGVISPVPEPT